MRAIKVVDYDPSWPLLFAEISAEVSSSLGDLVLSIDHIGSTSVPGLAAKPKIDLDVVMISDDVLSTAIGMVRARHFVFHGDTGEKRWAFTRDHEGHGFRLYLCGPGNRAHRERVLFRDYLRNHPERARIYADLKRRLAAEADGDWNFYTGGKSRFRQRNAAIGQPEHVKSECAAHSVSLPISRRRSARRRSRACRHGLPGRRDLPSPCAPPGKRLCCSRYRGGAGCRRSSTSCRAGRP